VGFGQGRHVVSKPIHMLVDRPGGTQTTHGGRRRLGHQCVVDAMEKVPTGLGDRPNIDVVIDSVTTTESD
jgi:hypothetical protein